MGNFSLLLSFPPTPPDSPLFSPTRKLVRLQIIWSRRWQLAQSLLHAAAAAFGSVRWTHVRSGARLAVGGLASTCDRAGTVART